MWRCWSCFHGSLTRTQQNSFTTLVGVQEVFFSMKLRFTKDVIINLPVGKVWVSSLSWENIYYILASSWIWIYAFKNAIWLFEESSIFILNLRCNNLNLNHGIYQQKFWAKKSMWIYLMRLLDTKKIVYPRNIKTTSFYGVKYSKMKNNFQVSHFASIFITNIQKRKRIQDYCSNLT